MNVARFLLRDGNKVGAEVSPEGLEVFTYEDQKGQLIHALATVKAEREFLSKSPRSCFPCMSVWSRPLPGPLDGTETSRRSSPGETIGQVTARSWFRRP